MTNRIPRRSFLKGAAGALGAAAGLKAFGAPAVLANAAPNSQIARLGERFVAFADVDEKQFGKAQKQLAGQYPDIKFDAIQRFYDYREMLDKLQKQIDVVFICAPDHHHAPAAIRAMKLGRGVYCEKPLAHSVYEVRQLMKAAKEHKVVTQLGNQGHSFNSIRDFCEWVWDGAIGKVHTIHAGCAAMNSGLHALPRLKEHHTPPATLDWDLWLGPAQQRPYHPAYLPGAWRGWVPFGNGTVGDWTCHVVDPVFWALDLGAPKSVMAEVKDYDPKTQGDAFPRGEKITFEFPGNAKRGPITMYWYSGSERIPRPEGLDPDDKGVDTGAVVLGDKGTILYGSHGAGGVRLVPQARMEAYKRPAKTLPRVKEHHHDWLQAIRNGTKAGSDFAYGGPLTELAMLGVIAIKFPGTRLEWDTAQMRFANHAEANAHINPPYRSGWEL
jgi:predicted dehydrogenase